MPRPESPANDLANAGRGLLMGAADIIPGVSGGTVALLLGIYPRLLTAISHVDGQLFRNLRAGQWRSAAQHLDLRFLIALAVGIVSGILLLAGVLHYLLHDHRELTLSAFFGLILASSVIVLRMIRPTSSNQTTVCCLLALAAALFAGWLVLEWHPAPQEGRLYIFVSGAIAICAMILPGISGAYILVLLNQYEHITGILHDLKAREVTFDQLQTLAVFAAGCLFGLLAFSKVLKALLARQYNATMAVLGGFMIGSLVKVWPFQHAVGGETEITKTTITYPAWPTGFNAHVGTCLAIALAAFGAVIVADYLAQRTRKDSRA